MGKKGGAEKFYGPLRE
jgi:hypothetical protein